MSKSAVVAQIEQLMKSLVDDHGALIVTLLTSFDDGTQDERTVSAPKVGKPLADDAVRDLDTVMQTQDGRAAFNQLLPGLLSSGRGVIEGKQLDDGTNVLVLCPELARLLPKEVSA